MQLQRSRLRRRQTARAQRQIQADPEDDDNIIISFPVRQQHQFREQSAELEPVAEHVVWPFELQKTILLIRSGAIFLNHAVQRIERDQARNHLQPAVHRFVGGDRARNAHGIGHR